MAQMLHTQPYRLSSGYRQQSAAPPQAVLPALWQRSKPHLQNACRYALKVTLVFLVSVGFLACASYILASSAGLLIKLMALTAWACGFVPVSYHLWSRDREA